ncbi:MAG TPA: hypothetical protein VFJ15_00965 [Oleiagrimonas sp.]|nr:hypothetical protein [Oleiagrimonas sp.]
MFIIRVLVPSSGASRHLLPGGEGKSWLSLRANQVQGMRVKKIMLVVILAGLAFWYFDYSRRMTVEGITASYQEQVQALNKMDGEYLCDHLADDYDETGTVHSGSGTKKRALGKSQACKHFKQMATLRERAGPLLGSAFLPHYDIEVKHIELAPDGKSATVKVVQTIKMGDMLFARARGTEHVIRRTGRMLTQSVESDIWMYARR